MISRRSFLTAAAIAPAAPAILKAAAPRSRFVNIFVTDMIGFCERFWPVVHGQQFQPTAEAKAMCLALEDITEYRRKNLVMIVPPRSGKSTILSVMWPAWGWSRRFGSQRYLSTAGSGMIALRNARDFRKLINSKEYRDCYWPTVKLLRHDNQKGLVSTTNGGYYLARGVGETSIGVGADRIICDEPQYHMPHSQAEQAMVIDWWDNVRCRLTDPRTSSMVVATEFDQPGTLGHNLRKEFDGVLICRRG